MSESPKQSWRIEIGHTGQTCRIFCDEILLTTVQEAWLHLAVGQPSTLDLRLVPSWSPRSTEDTTPFFHHDDDLSAVGKPRVYIEIEGRKFRVMEVMREGDLDERLFYRAR